MHYRATMSSKGQVTIPVEIRRALGLSQGDIVQFFSNPDGSVTVVPKNRDIMEMAGSLAHLPDGAARDDDAALTAALSERHGTPEVREDDAA